MKNIQYRYTDRRYVGRKMINGKTYLVYAKTQKECAQKLKDLLFKVANGINPKSKTSQVLFINYWNKWYEENKKPFVSKDTQAEIERIKNKLIDLHNIPIKKLDKTMIIKVLNKFKDNRAKEKIIVYLNACLKTAFNDGTIKGNPFANIVTKPRVFKRKPAFSYEQQLAILERLKREEIKPIILIYLITGLRRRELNFKSIENDLYQDELILKSVNLKGRNQIKRYKQIQLSKAGFMLIKNNIELLKRYDEEKVYRRFAEILKELNIEGSIVNLRHTFATNNFYLGNPELFISRQMGHSTSQITKDNYTDIDYHLSKEKIQKIYSNLYYIF